ncbi:MAG: hypothetical protein IT370_32265 [Deltaproteobacteria bacterium]|nr:hypothetical protein [Deltaproteobacteria bacterium]
MRPARFPLVSAKEGSTRLEDHVQTQGRYEVLARSDRRWKVNAYPCPCCDYSTLPEPPPGTFAICPICGWEDDNVQFDDPTSDGGANPISLNQARSSFLATGKADASSDVPTRNPTSDELLERASRNADAGKG